MPAATFEQIMNDLKKKVYHPVYMLHGEEPYYIDQISDYIEAHVLDATEKEFNQLVIYGRDTDLVTVVGQAKQFPMMSNYQVVIVKEAQDLKELGKKKGDVADESGNFHNADDAIPLIKYLENPLKSTVLVFCYKHKTLDKRTKISKVLEKSSVVFESKSVKEDKIPAWAIAYCKSKGKKLDQEAAVLIGDHIGTDLSRITNELDKLIINIHEEKQITSTDIEKYIGISKEFNVFELQKAMSARDMFKVNKITEYMAQNQKNNPLVVLLGSFFFYFNKIIIYHTMKGKPSGEIAAALGVPPFYIGDYQAAARSFNPEQAVNAIAILHEFDLRSKGIRNGGTTSGELLREMIQKLMERQSSAVPEGVS